MHKLLQRQIRKAFGDHPPSDEAFAAFVQAVDAAYSENDKDRALLERSMDLASAELLERNVRLERDLLSIQRLEMELRQAEKLRAVGQLASGIAHEINTPIQFVGDSVRFLEASFDDLLQLGERGRTLCAALAAGEPAAPALASIESLAEDIDLDYLLGEIPKAFEATVDGIRRVAAIVLAMKEFGRPDQREKVPVAISRCIDNALQIARSELKFAAEVEVELGSVPDVPGYPGEISQVILNLLINAAHAIGARWGAALGRIRVASACDGDWVTVSVTDNGCGIRPEHRGRIFEPFFTTKEVGKGSGQGLALARSIIVDKHGGLLLFESEAGQGTTFTMKLPTGDASPPDAMAEWGVQP